MNRTISKFALAAGVSLALAFTFSCSDDKEEGGYNCSADFEGVTIGTQTWMAKNLNCDVKGSLCYNNNPAMCETYGRLYDWETAKKVCPSGWHLPDSTEWQTLVGFAGGEVAGEKLRAASGWDVDGNGTDDYDFSALPGGSYSSSGGNFSSIGTGGLWWTAREFDASNACFVNMVSVHGRVGGSCDKKSTQLSVRCIKD